MTSGFHVRTSWKLSDVSYSLRGPLAAQAERMRAAGEDVLGRVSGHDQCVGFALTARTNPVVRGV